MARPKFKSVTELIALIGNDELIKCEEGSWNWCPLTTATAKYVGLPPKPGNVGEPLVVQMFETDEYDTYEWMFDTLVEELTDDLRDEAISPGDDKSSFIAWATGVDEGRLDRFVSNWDNDHYMDEDRRDDPEWLRRCAELADAGHTWGRSPEWCEKGKIEADLDDDTDDIPY